MTEKRIADVFEIKNRFLRSAHLERDFHDSAALEGYVPTEFVRACLDRIGDGLRPRSGHRAWRMGDRRENAARGMAYRATRRSQ